MVTITKQKPLAPQKKLQEQESKPKFKLFSTQNKLPKHKSVQYDQWGYFFIAPFFIVYFIFSLIPLITTFYYSFFEYYRVGITEVGPKFNGIKNYISIFTTDDNLGRYFWNTIIMWIMGFVPQIVISLLLAVWFTNTELKLKCQRFFKTVIYMPNLIMAAAFSMLFFTLFSANGPINSIIKSMVDKMNMPDVQGQLNALVANLNAYVSQNESNAPLKEAIASVISSIQSVSIPKGSTLSQVNAIIDSLRESSMELFRNSYSGVEQFRVLGIISDGLSTTVQPMKSIYFFESVWFTRGLVALMNFLMWYGNTTIMLMAGVMGIDNSLFEAARIDGANPLQVFFKITIPLLLPIFVYVLITSLIGGIQMFDVPQILTNGSGNPNRTIMTIIMKLNKNLYSKNYGLAGSTSVFVFIITAILSTFVYKSTMSKYSNKR